MAIRLRFENGDQLAPKFQRGTKRFADRTAKATTYAARKAAQEIEKRGRKNIAAAGNFNSARWQDGFRALVSYVSRHDLNIRVVHRVKYWKIFQFGGVIKGNPLLWIPLSFAKDAIGVRARDYPQPLFRVDRAGKAPLLVSRDGPKYFGKPFVTMPKKFRLIEISRTVFANIGRYYKEGMKRNGG